MSAHHLFVACLLYSSKIYSNATLDRNVTLSNVSVSESYPRMRLGLERGRVRGEWLCVSGKTKVSISGITGVTHTPSRAKPVKRRFRKKNTINCDGDLLGSLLCNKK